MQVTIRDIGNSKGVILPSGALKEAGIGEKVDLQVKNGRIILQASDKPRAGWMEAIQQDPPAKEQIFMDGVEDGALMEEWTW